MDETSVPFYQGRTKGLLLRRGLRRWYDLDVPFAPVERSTYRLNCTHVATIANDAAAQAWLPQFIIINERFCKLSELDDLRSSLPPNAVLLRQKSAWNTADTMVFPA